MLRCPIGDKLLNYVILENGLDSCIYSCILSCLTRNCSNSDKSFFGSMPFLGDKSLIGVLFLGG